MNPIELSWKEKTSVHDTIFYSLDVGLGISATVWFDSTWKWQIKGSLINGPIKSETSRRLCHKNARITLLQQISNFIDELGGMESIVAKCAFLELTKTTLAPLVNAKFKLTTAHLLIYEDSSI